MKKIAFAFCLCFAGFCCGGITFASEVNQAATGNSNPQSASSELEGVAITYNGGKSYIYIERTDLRRYDNGKYKGLVSREVRSSIVAVNGGPGSDGNTSNGAPSNSENTNNSFLTNNAPAFFEGNFYVWEATRRASSEIFPGLDDSIPSSFTIDEKGQFEMLEDSGYPTFRGFPSFTTKKIKPGDSWQSYAVRTVDPLNKGLFTKLKFLVQYTYLRDEIYNGEEVFLLSAKWATRYGGGNIDPAGDSDLVSASGSHSATIYVSKETGMALVVRDSVDEYFVYRDGNKIAFKGTINLFTKYPPAFNSEEVYKVIERVAGAGGGVNVGNAGSDGNTNSGRSSISGGSAGNGGMSGIDGNTSNSSLSTISDVPAFTSDNTNDSAAIPGLATVEKTDNGIRLSIPNLQFKSDSPELLDSEKNRLDKLAEILSSTGSAMLLIEGHTASTGNPTGELQLSKERAKKIAAELVKRGISADRFVIKGRGALRPIADNSTKEGMAKNRRVEITILK